MGTRLQLRPGELAAAVNGLVVLFLPVAVIGALTLIFHNAGTGGAARPPGWQSRSLLVVAAGSAVGMSPWALIAAWRTWTHATRWDAGDRGWWGIAEAGACGLAAALLVLLPGIISRPREAPAYVIIYGGMGLVVGLAVGVLLFATARFVLLLAHGTTTTPTP